jgi:recombination protein RecA
MPGHQGQHAVVKAAHGMAQQAAQVRLPPILRRRQQVERHAYIVRQTDQKNHLQMCICQIKYCSCIQPVFQHSLQKVFNPLIPKEFFMDNVKSIAAAGEKAKALQAALAQIEKQFGKGTIMRLGEGEVIEDIQVVSTGSLGLDVALGVGGLPRGRVIEIYGPESSGKTTLTLQVIAEMQKMAGTCAFVDAEHALDVQYAQKLGVNLQDLLISQPDTGEQALEIVDSLVRSGAVDLIVIDSVAALTPKAELEGEMGDSLPGLQARLMSQALRKLTAHIKKTNCTVIFINQIRMKIGVMFGSPETTTGGNALKFYASVRLDIRRTGTIKKGEESIGNETKVKVVKNKVAPPFKTAEFDILFGEGISRHGEIIDMGVAAKIVDKSGAWYAYQGEKIGQGRDNAREFLRENHELAIEIENKVRESLNIPLLAVEVEETKLQAVK